MNFSPDRQLFTHGVKAFEDNYIWLINKVNSKNIVIVDPGDSTPVLEYVNAHHFTPVAILVTHHHADHIAGINGILKYFKIPVFGPGNENIHAITHAVQEGEMINLDAINARFQVMAVPGHTRGHVAYYGQGMLFCGDTLFAGGCGRIFEGTPVQMYESLEKIRHLPDETLIFCAHEYTQDNLDFSRVVEPDNPALLDRIRNTATLRQQQLPTVPSTLELEKQTNPFLRCHLPNVTQAAESFALKTIKSGADTFSIVRYWKDTLD